MIVMDQIEQLSPEWFAEHAGVPGASSFDKIVASKGAPSKSRQGYLYQLAGEAITGKKEAGYSSPAMDEGVNREQESRELYEMINKCEVEQVGMAYPDEQKKYLCSPDGLIERKRGLELKNVIPKTQVQYLLDGKLPTKYFIQCQGSLLVTGCDAWDFMSYCPGMPPFIIQVERDEIFIQKLESELDSFVIELAGIIKKLKTL